MLHGNPHPWRYMAMVFGGVLLCSFALLKVLSPAGDAMLRAVDGNQATITGTIAPSPTEPGKLALYHGRAAYILSDQAKARAYAGRAVRIAGILHQSTGLLEIRKIEPADLKSVK